MLEYVAPLELIRSLSRRNACLGFALCALAAACGGSSAQQGGLTATPRAGTSSVAAPTAGVGAAAGVSALGTAGTTSSAVAGTTATAGMPAAAVGGSAAPAAGSGGSQGTSGVGGAAGTAALAGSGGSAGTIAAAGTGGVAGSGAGAGAGGMMATSGGLDSMQTLIPDPSWPCGMPDGIPPATGALVFEADLQVGDVHDVGDTQYGHRIQIDISGGTLTGSKINGTLMDRGLDYQLTLTNGVIEDEQINIIKTSDGSSIYFRNCGTAPNANGEVRMVPDFEAPTASAYAFLNTGKFVGTRAYDPDKKTLKISIHEASASVDKTNAVQLTDPSGVPNQTWECKKAAGTKGAVVYMESVGIGAGSVAVGASKNGTRNIVPITGGTTTGKIAGPVLSGGADYQLIGSSFVLDARYTLHPADDEFIIVRNCGPVGGLVPVFEARTNGKYAWVNDNHWLSSDPGVGAGVVNLTIYEGGM